MPHSFANMRVNRLPSPVTYVSQPRRRASSTSFVSPPPPGTIATRPNDARVLVRLDLHAELPLRPRDELRVRAVVRP